jgi:Ni,Fe-hydrogenase I cytochrome b subunit
VLIFFNWCAYIYLSVSCTKNRDSPTQSFHEDPLLREDNWNWERIVVLWVQKITNYFISVPPKGKGYASQTWFSFHYVAKQIFMLLFRVTWEHTGNRGQRHAGPS